MDADERYVPFTPVMYPYRGSDGLVEPLWYSSQRLFSFPETEEGIYYLEVEELLGDPGQFTMTLLD